MFSYFLIIFQFGDIYLMILLDSKLPYFIFPILNFSWVPQIPFNITIQLYFFHCQISLSSFRLIYRVYAHQIHTIPHLYHIKLSNLFKNVIEIYNFGWKSVYQKYPSDFQVVFTYTNKNTKTIFFWLRDVLKHTR